MKVEVKQITSWSRALDAARMTIGKEPLYKEPSDEWKDKILMAEHSPIRVVEYDIYLEGIPSFVAMHLVRHHIGCEKFVVTNREDRRNVNPEEVNRLTPVDMMMTCNAQALINISRKRLCNCASKETREVWQAVKDAIAEIDPIMARRMCRECVYRGFCPEMKPCGFCNSAKYNQEMLEYFKGKDKSKHIDILEKLAFVEWGEIEDKYIIESERRFNERFVCVDGRWYVKQKNNNERHEKVH